MSRRTNPSLELRQPSMLQSQEAAKSSSGEFPELSSSFSSSGSYTPKMPNESPEAEDQKVQSVTETKAMDIVGCPRCFMYVLLSEDDPKCPKCKTTAFLEIFKDENFKKDN